MKFEYFNSNPDASVFKSGKPKSWNRKDNAIRAICKALNSNWESVYKSLYEIGKEKHDMMDSKNVVADYIEQHDFEFVSYGKPKKDERRPTVEEFLNEHQSGTYILYLRDYYVTIIDGVVYDINESSKNMSVYSYWRKCQ